MVMVVDSDDAASSYGNEGSDSGGSDFSMQPTAAALVRAVMSRLGWVLWCLPSSC
jgi:hypothetical protein